MRKEVFARYGIPWSERNGWTVDHLIPCELAGASTLANLWPQRILDAEKKDIGDAIALRLKGTRTSYEIPVAHLLDDLCRR